MANKLRDIFADDDFNINCTIRFKDKDAYNKFVSSLESVQNEGNVVPVDGIVSISESIHDQTGNYPLGTHEHITHFVVGPSIDLQEIELIINGLTKIIVFQRYHTNDYWVLQTAPDSIVYLKFMFYKNADRHTLSYTIQFSNASSLTDVIEAFETTEAILAYIYKSDGELLMDDKNISIADVKKYFKYSTEFFKRLFAITEKFHLSIDPKLLENISDEIVYDIEELYLHSYKNKVLRLNAKLNSTESTSITTTLEDKSLLIGNAIKFTFLGNISFQIFDQTITLFTTNLLLNAVVKEIRKNEEDVTVFYGNTDSKPMYISYKAFIDEEEAKKELSSIFDHEDDYICALTRNEYIKSYLQ